MEPANKNYSLFFILIAIVLEAILFSIGNYKSNVLSEEAENNFKKLQNIFENTDFEAEAFSVYNISSNKKIYGKNDKVKMPIASLTKIMTVITALNIQDVDGIINISSEAIKQQGDYGFFANEKFKIKDLARFTLVGSANDSAYALLENIPDALEKMNTKARKIGMEDVSFFNFTGLDLNENEAGVYASAEDVNIMAMYAFKAYPDVFSASVMPEISFKSESGFDHSIKNTNIILDKIPNILFSKTGLTPLAGGNLSVIFKNQNGHGIAVTVLNSTEAGRFSDMEKIVNSMYNLNY